MCYCVICVVQLVALVSTVFVVSFWYFGPIDLSRTQRACSVVGYVGAIGYQIAFIACYFLDRIDIRMAFCWATASGVVFFTAFNTMNVLIIWETFVDPGDRFEEVLYPTSLEGYDEVAAANMYRIENRTICYPKRADAG